MLSITTSPPAAWSPAPVTAIAPVSAATPVAPVQATARDAQTGSGTAGGGNTANLREGSAGQRAREREDRRPEAAPLLPRPSPEDGRQGRQSTAAEAEQAEAEREQQVQEAQEQARQQRLQDVIANVWKASAAVVDRALGLDSEDGRAVSAAAAADAAQPVAATAATAVPVVAPVAPMMGAANDPQIEIEALKAGQDVVAYDAQGNSSLEPLEAGTLLDRRV